MAADKPTGDNVAIADPMPAPDVLTAGEAVYWRAWAPLAQARGLLHPATSPGFVLLCKHAYRADAIWSCVEARGYEHERLTIDGAGQEHREYKANSLIGQWRGLMTRVEQLQARYGLAADGKVAVGASLTPDDEAAEPARLLAIR